MKFENYVITSLIVGLAVALSFFMPPFYAAIIIPALCFGILLIGNPRGFLALYFWVMGIYPLLKTIFPFGPVKYLNELLGVLLFGMFLMLLSLRRLDFREIKKWGLSFGFFMGYVALTWLMNRGTPRGALQTLFSYFSFIPFFILLVSVLRSKDFSALLWGSVGFFWFNVLLNAGWLLGINPLYNRAFDFLETHGYGSGYVDASIGTFGTCDVFSYFCVFLFFLLFSVYRNIELVGRKRKKLLLITIVILLVQLYWTFTNHAYLFFAIAFIPFALTSGTGKKWHFVLLGVVAVLGFNILTATSEQWGLQFSEENLSYRYEKLYYSAKVQLLDNLVVRNAQDNPVEWFFGVGPGNGMGQIGKDNLTPFALRMLLEFYQSADMQTMQMDSITGNTSSAIFTLWGDLGLIGFFLWVSIYGVALKKCVNVIRSTSSLQKRVVAESLIGILVMFALVNVAQDVLSNVFITTWIWGLFAFLYLPEQDDHRETALTGIDADSLELDADIAYRSGT